MRLFLEFDRRTIHTQSHVINHSEIQTVQLINLNDVAAPENEIFDLLLDPGTSAERRLGDDERLLLRSLSTAANMHTQWTRRWVT